jgi:hypothetical protein
MIGYAYAAFLVYLFARKTPPPLRLINGGKEGTEATAQTPDGGTVVTGDLPDSGYVPAQGNVLPTALPAPPASAPKPANEPVSAPPPAPSSPTGGGGGGGGYTGSNVLRVV